MVCSPPSPASPPHVHLWRRCRLTDRHRCELKAVRKLGRSALDTTANPRLSSCTVQSRTHHPVLDRTGIKGVHCCTTEGHYGKHRGLPAEKESVKGRRPHLSQAAIRPGRPARRHRQPFAASSTARGSRVGQGVVKETAGSQHAIDGHHLLGGAPSCCGKQGPGWRVAGSAVNAAARHATAARQKKHETLVTHPVQRRPGAARATCASGAALVEIAMQAAPDSPGQCHRTRAP